MEAGRRKGRWHGRYYSSSNPRFGKQVKLMKRMYLLTPYAKFARFDKIGSL